MLFFQSIVCSNELKWIKIFNSFQSILLGRKRIQYNRAATR